MEARSRNPEPVRQVPLPHQLGGTNRLRIQTWIRKVGRYGVILLINIGRTKRLAIYQLENIVARRMIDQRNPGIGARLDAAVVVVAESRIQTQIAGNRQLILHVECPDVRLAPVIKNQRIRIEVVVTLILAKIVAILSAARNAIPAYVLGDLQFSPPPFAIGSIYVRADLGSIRGRR